MSTTFRPSYSIIRLRSDYTTLQPRTLRTERLQRIEEVVVLTGVGVVGESGGVRLL